MLEFDSHRALLVDLYELTMAAAYFEQHVDCHATFELFARQLPPERTFLVAGGIEDALDYLADLQFSDEDVSFLRGLPVFRNVSSEFFEYLRKLRFTGDVEAVDQGGRRDGVDGGGLEGSGNRDGLGDGADFEHEVEGGRGVGVDGERFLEGLESGVGDGDGVVAERYVEEGEGAFGVGVGGGGEGGAGGSEGDVRTGKRAVLGIVDDTLEL